MKQRWLTIHVWAVIASASVLLLIANYGDAAASADDKVKRAAFVVRVLDARAMAIAHAAVECRMASGTAIHAEWDSVHEWYAFFERLTEGDVTVAHPDYEPNSRRVPGGAATSLTVFLGRPGDSYTYVSEGRVPYSPNLHMIGIVASAAMLPAIQAAVAPFHCTVMNGPRMIVVSNAAPFERAGCAVLAAIRALPNSPECGMLIGLAPGGAVIQTNRAWIRFRDRVADSTRLAVLRNAGLRFIRENRFDSRVLAAATDSVGDAINDSLRELAGDEAVLEVEGEFIGTEPNLEATSPKTNTPRH